MAAKRQRCFLSPARQTHTRWPGLGYGSPRGDVGTGPQKSGATPGQCAAGSAADQAQRGCSWTPTPGAGIHACSR